MITMLRRVCARSALAGVFLGCAAGVTLAAAQQTMRFGDWSAQCEADAQARQSCVLRQLLVDDRGRKILGVTISRQGSGLAIEADGPLGLSIPFGLSLQVDDERIPLQMLSCSPAGCIAASRLDEESLGRLTGARAVSVVFKDYATDKILSVAISPAGLVQGIALIKAL
jgi:invasion protein IalB